MALADDIQQFNEDTTTMHEFVHGTSSGYVDTESGSVMTIPEAGSRMEDAVDAIEASGQATTSAAGIAALATDAETQTGTVTDKIVTPAGLQSKTASDAETYAGSSTTKIVTPSNLSVMIRYETTLDNVCVGEYAGSSLTTGYNNINIGYTSGYGIADGAQNVNVGAGAGYAIVGGDSNTNVGHQAGNSVTSGVNNSNFGAGSGTDITDGGYNTNIGENSGVGTTTEDNTSCIGYYAAITASNQVQLGNSSTTTYAYGSVQDRSDKRDKYDISESDLGLDFIERLRPVSFKWDYREDYIDRDKKEKINDAKKDGTKERTRPHYGLIAQDVKSVIDELNIDFGGFQDHSKNGGQDVMSLGYQEFIAPMIKAIQELSQKVKDLEAQIASIGG